MFSSAVGAGVRSCKNTQEGTGSSAMHLGAGTAFGLSAVAAGIAFAL